jgi:prevent-host-death family protein
MVSSTEVQNRFGKYLQLAVQEEIIITRNGVPVAKLCSLEKQATSAGIFPGIVTEEAPSPDYGGKKATYQQFLSLTKDSEIRCEYIDGEIHMLASPKIEHQLALMELFVIFRDWFQGKPCTPVIAPFDITLKRPDGQINVVQPDIMVICDLEEKLQNGYYTGVPTLIIEVISESTARIDLIKKLDLYMSCGVEEYWLANPQNKEITVHSFKEQQLAGYTTYKPPETAVSQVFPGLCAELAKVFR